MTLDDCVHSLAGLPYRLTRPVWPDRPVAVEFGWTHTVTAEDARLVWTPGVVKAGTMVATVKVDAVDSPVGFALVLTFVGGATLRVEPGRDPDGDEGVAHWSLVTPEIDLEVGPKRSWDVEELNRPVVRREPRRRSEDESN